MMNPVVLVADDDKEIVYAIEKMLEKEGIRTVCAYNGREAVARLMEEEIHLVILDIMMPEMDGIKALLKIRENNNIPIILLSAKTEEADKVAGLNTGADDYVTKPFSPPELMARVHSQLRRYMNLGDYSATQTQTQILIDGLFLDDEARRVCVDGTEVRLTAKEYCILAFLMKHAGKIFSAEEIYDNVWHEKAYAVENTIMVHIRRIREKIEINPKEPRYLKVVWGVGYKIEDLGRK